eukprot:9241_1
MAMHPFNHLQYQTLRTKLKEGHEERIHELELKYATIIVALLKEKETVHKELQNKFYGQLDQLSQVLLQQSTVPQFTITNNISNTNNSDRKSSVNQNQNIPPNIAAAIERNAQLTSQIRSSTVPFQLGGIKNVSVSDIKAESEQTLLPPKIPNNPIISAPTMNDDSQSSSDDETDDSFLYPARSRRESEVTNEDDKSLSDDANCLKVDDGFACGICGKVLKRAYDIKRHIQCVHSAERPHICETCGSRFKLMFHLTEHKVTHLAVKPFKCHFCEKRFRRKRDVTKHCQRKHKEKWDNHLHQALRHKHGSVI